jgi:prepilin-type N-terminal cleavage/methylation domain-containing protein
MNYPKSQKGFTLIEALVAMAIFVVVVAVGAGIFLTISRAQQKAINVSETQKDARFALEAMVKEVRMGTIDYQYYEDNDLDLSKKISELAIVSSNQEYLVFRQSADSKLEVAINAAYQKKPTNFQPMVREGVKIQTLNFYISPFSSPYKEGAIRKQPRATIILRSEIQDQKNPERNIKVDLETTVTSRVYK